MLTVKAILGLTADLEPTIGTISPVVNLYGRQKALEKSRQLALASAMEAVIMHNYLVYIAIS